MEPATKKRHLLFWLQTNRLVPSLSTVWIKHPKAVSVSLDCGRGITQDLMGSSRHRLVHNFKPWPSDLDMAVDRSSLTAILQKLYPLLTTHSLLFRCLNPSEIKTVKKKFGGISQLGPKKSVIMHIRFNNKKNQSTKGLHFHILSKSV